MISRLCGDAGKKLLPQSSIILIFTVRQTQTVMWRAITCDCQMRLHCGAYERLIC
jgi:hypothetical protein